MKKIIKLTFILVSGAVYSQVAIGKKSVTNSSVSLEFGNAPRGIITPWVTSSAAVAQAVQGTIIFDQSDKKVKIKYPSGWKDLSVRQGLMTSAEVSSQNTKTENPNAKVIIGPNPDTDTTPGILVLSATNKAMILPKVEKPYESIIDPAPGTIVYDTDSKKLCIFNGKEWTFWYPE